MILGKLDDEPLLRHKLKECTSFRTWPVFEISANQAPIQRDLTLYIYQCILYVDADSARYSQFSFHDSHSGPRLPACDHLSGNSEKIRGDCKDSRGQNRGFGSEAVHGTRRELNFENCSSISIRMDRGVE